MEIFLSISSWWLETSLFIRVGVNNCLDTCRGHLNHLTRWWVRLCQGKHRVFFKQHLNSNLHKKGLIHMFFLPSFLCSWLHKDHTSSCFGTNVWFGMDIMRCRVFQDRRRMPDCWGSSQFWPSAPFSTCTQHKCTLYFTQIQQLSNLRVLQMPSCYCRWVSRDWSQKLLKALVNNLHCSPQFLTGSRREICGKTQQGLGKN